MSPFTLSKNSEELAANMKSYLDYVYSQGNFYSDFPMEFKDCSFDQLEEAKARMGISKYKAELFSKLIALESKTAEWLEKKKMDNSRGIIDTLLSIRKSKDREDAISLAESLGIQEPKEMEDFLK